MNVATVPQDRECLGVRNLGLIRNVGRRVSRPGGTFLARARVGVRVCPPFCASRAYCESRISVNAAGVAEIAPPIFDLQGPPLLTTPQYFDMCFIFFPSAELLNTAKSLSFSSAMRPVYSFNSTVEQNSLQMTTCLFATIIYTKFVETCICQSVSFVRHKLVLL